MSADGILGLVLTVAQVHAIRAVVEEGSVAAGARALGLGVTTVNKQLFELRRRTGSVSTLQAACYLDDRVPGWRKPRPPARLRRQEPPGRAIGPSTVRHQRLDQVVSWRLRLSRAITPEVDPAFCRRGRRDSASADQSTPSTYDHHALADSANRRGSEHERPLVHRAALRLSLEGDDLPPSPSIQPSDSAAGRPSDVCCVRHVTTFSVATNEYVGNGKEKAEFHSVVTWDRLAEICAGYLGKGMTVALEGRIQTRQWDDDRGAHHWRTEIVASAVEMLSGRRKKDYAADALAVQANALGVQPAVESGRGDDDDDADPGLAPGDPEPEAAVLVA